MRGVKAEAYPVYSNPSRKMKNARPLRFMVTLPDADIFLADIIQPYARKSVDISSYTTVMTLKMSPGEAEECTCQW